MSMAESKNFVFEINMNGLLYLKILRRHLLCICIVSSKRSAKNANPLRRFPKNCSFYHPLTTPLTCIATKSLCAGSFIFSFRWLLLDKTDCLLYFVNRSLISCRYGIPHDYDIVIGAMANDQIYNYIADYIDGIITRDQFWSLAKFKYPTHQINFLYKEIE